MTACVSGTCGTGRYGAIAALPGDPDNNSVLSATPAFGGIDVAWTYPGTNPHGVGHVRIYRAHVNPAAPLAGDFNTANLLAIVNGNFHFDRVQTGQAYHYWIQIVSVNGTIGTPIGPATAQANPLIADMLALLAGQIDNSVLGQALKADIAKIGTTFNSLSAEIDNRVAGQAALASSFAAVQNQATQTAALVGQEVTARQNADGALAQQINLVAVASGNEIAAVEQTLQATNDRVNGIGALYTVKVNVNGLAGGFGVYNNGQQVSAGFDVDTFFIGRTDDDKIKPFIVSGETVYIAKAAIKNADIDTLKIAGDAVTLISTYEHLPQGASGNVVESFVMPHTGTYTIVCATLVTGVYNTPVSINYGLQVTGGAGQTITGQGTTSMRILQVHGSAPAGSTVQWTASFSSTGVTNPGCAIQTTVYRRYR